MAPRKPDGAASMRIGPFELDVDARELSRNGTRIRLQDQPFEILRALLERPGEVVTRDELRVRLWPDGTFVDFEHSLNAAVKRLRATLGDDAVEPRYIETIPRRGYRIVAPVTAPARSSSEIRPRLKRLAVLPFTDLSPRQRHGTVAEGLTDETIAQLGTICRGAVSVMARRSTLAFQHTSERVRQIGEALNAAYLLEGSLRVEDDRIRVTVRLVDAAEETLLWSDGYDRPAGKTLDVQTEVATRIAHGVAGTLPSATPAPVSRVLATRQGADPHPQDAYRAFLKGEYFWNKPGNQGLDQALEFYAEGLKLAPTFAAAHAAMGRGLLSRAEYYRELPRAALVRAREAAGRALELDSRQAEAHLTLADVSRMLDFDWVASRASYERAIALNPVYEGAHRAFALLLSALSEHRHAREVADAASRLDPMCLQVGINAAWVRYAARDYEGAIDRSLYTLDLDRAYAPARRLLGTAYLLAGAEREALDVFETGLAQHPDDAVLKAWAVHANGVAGEQARAEMLLEELTGAQDGTYVPSYALGIARLGVGDLQRAFEAIEAGYEERDPLYSTLATDPRFDDVRHDSRFARLTALARLGG